jgi:O-antigen/teichoic acid export membrane protein
MAGKVSALTGGKGDAIFAMMFRGGVASLVLASTGLALGLVGQVLVSRLLGAHEFGRYAIILGWCMVFVTPVTAGMDFILLRYAPAYMSEGQTPQLLGLLKFVAIVLITTTTLASVLLFVVSFAAPGVLGTATAAGIASMVVLTGAMAFMNTFSTVFRAAKRIVLSQTYSQVVRPVLVIGAVCAAYVTGIFFDAESAILITALAAALALAALLGHLRATYIRGPSKPVERAQVYDWFLLGLPLLFVTTIQQVLTQSNVMFLGALSTPIEAGQFAVASRLATLATFGMSALASITSPMIVTAHQAGDVASLRRIASVNARLALVCALGVACVLLAAGSYVLQLFGPGFEQAWQPMVILLVSGIISAASGPAAQLLMMTGKQNQVLLVMLVALAVHVILSLALIPEYGASGSAIAASAAIAVSTAMMMWRAWESTGVDSSILGRSAGVSSEREVL